ncbi:M23 family metallopeptidase [Sphingomonas sp. PAMC 26605]|uniref:M23 family metallopeptidase n=1 Tax=Sphingomonas sp. PAMC 26605 TaxID=1112214 RepID=UPI00026CD796|nr:M23 family metallopeptidase [Sphingomonas sp. PAMC 26605]
MNRVARFILISLAIIAAAWIALLALLPEASRRIESSAAPSPAGTPLPAAGAAALGEGSVLAVPVGGMRRQDLRDSWGDPRENGLREHHGADLMAPSNTPVTAAAPGMVEKLWVSAAGGTTVYVRSPARNWTYYYAHLSGYAPGLQEGQSVKVGDVLGYVGDTGNAGAGNFHLHFGLTHTTPDQHWYEGTDVDPYPYLAGKPLPR